MHVLIVLCKLLLMLHKTSFLLHDLMEKMLNEESQHFEDDEVTRLRVFWHLLSMHIQLYFEKTLMA